MMINSKNIIKKQFLSLLKNEMSVSEFLAKALKILKYPYQYLCLYRVHKRKWQGSQDVQLSIFAERENYAFYQLTKSKGDVEAKQILFQQANDFLNSYDRHGYAFETLFKNYAPPRGKVLQIAIGACPELIALKTKCDFEYYVEDPLMSQILKRIDLRKILVNEIKDFCGLPAEEMWPEYQEFFDVVISHNVLNHTYDPAKVIESVHKMLKVGGLVFDFTMRQPAGQSHPGLIGYKALMRGYRSRGFELIYSAIFKHLDYPSFPQKQRYYSLWRKK